MNRLSQPRLRLADLAAVAAAWALVSRIWFPVHAGWVPYLLILACWSAGLALTRTYRGDPPLSTAAGKLVLDHAVVTAAWAAVLYILDVRPGAVALASFAVLAFALMALVRAVLQLRLGGRGKPADPALRRRGPFARGLLRPERPRLGAAVPPRPRRRAPRRPAADSLAAGA